MCVVWDGMLIVPEYRFQSWAAGGSPWFFAPMYETHSCFQVSPSALVCTSRVALYAWRALTQALTFRVAPLPSWRINWNHCAIGKYRFAVFLRQRLERLL